MYSINIIRKRGQHDKITRIAGLNKETEIGTEAMRTENETARRTGLLD